MRADGSPDAADHRLRLFVALELPESARIATGAWTASALGTIDSLRPVRVDGLRGAVYQPRARIELAA